MLDADTARLIQFGTVKVSAGDVIVEGFDAEGATCREVAALATLWAIGRLQQELTAILERPGGSNICIGG